MLTPFLVVDDPQGSEIHIRHFAENQKLVIFDKFSQELKSRVIERFALESRTLSFYEDHATLIFNKSAERPNINAKDLTFRYEEIIAWHLNKEDHSLTMKIFVPGEEKSRLAYGKFGIDRLLYIGFVLNESEIKMIDQIFLKVPKFSIPVTDPFAKK